MSRITVLATLLSGTQLFWRWWCILSSKLLLRWDSIKLRLWLTWWTVIIWMILSLYTLCTQSTRFKWRLSAQVDYFFQLIRILLKGRPSNFILAGPCLLERSPMICICGVLEDTAFLRRILILKHLLFTTVHKVFIERGVRPVVRWLGRLRLLVRSYFTLRDILAQGLLCGKVL